MGDEARDEANYVRRKAKALVKKRAQEKGDKAITFEITKTASELEKEKSSTSRKTGHKEDLGHLIQIVKRGIKDLETYNAAAREDESFRPVQDKSRVESFLAYQAVYLQKNPRVKFTGQIGKEIDESLGAWRLEFRQKPKPKPTTSSPKKRKRGVKFTDPTPNKKTIVPNRGGREAKRLEKLRKSLTLAELEAGAQDREYKQRENHNQQIFANMLQAKGRFKEREWPLYVPGSSSGKFIKADLRETDNTPIEAKTADKIAEVQKAIGQARSQRALAREILKNDDIKSSLYFFTSNRREGFENFKACCEHFIARDRHEYKEVILFEEVELNDTKTEMPNILARWGVDGKIEWFV